MTARRRKAVPVAEQLAGVYLPGVLPGLLVLSLVANLGQLAALVVVVTR